MPAIRAGKGKAAMYIAGAGNSTPTSEPVQRPGSHAASSGPTWHKGAMSKRFDGKEESPLSKTPTVRVSFTLIVLTTLISLQQTSAAGSTAAQDDEQAAMAAMFQAQTANWEETQEKMSQLVSRSSASVLHSKSISHKHDLFSPFIRARFE